MNVLPIPTSLRNPFGRFSPDGNEYIISDLHTPRPWVNVMSNKHYGLVISQVGSGFSWIDNSQLQRLTRWDQDLTTDLFGRFVYVQDIANPDWVWSTTHMPTQIQADREEVVFGSGYAVFVRELHGIRTTMTAFVALDINAEYWLIEVENLREEEAELRFSSYIDLHLGSNGDWHREFHRLFMETQIQENVMVAFKHTGLRENSRLQERLPFVAYHTTVGENVRHWNADKIDFLGSPGDLRHPAYFRSPQSGRNTGRWDDPISSASVEISLQPGEVRRFAYALGAEDDKTDALARARSTTLESVDAALTTLKSHWQSTLSATQVETPDPVFDLMNNNWLKVQTIIGRLDARSAYYQQGGAYGYRDQLQDSLLYLSIDPSRTLDQLCLHSEAMYEDGGVRHWWHPNTSIFAESHHCDTCLWLAHGTLAYLDETNDLKSLEGRHRFLNRETQQFGETGTLLDHIFRGIDRALNRLSSRGLPLIGAGDWNDGLSHAGIEGKGESVWLAMFLYDILRRWKPILEEVGESGRADQFERAARSLQAAVEKHGWDGGWYIAGTKDDGNVFGGHDCAEGALFLNPQTWAVISEIAEGDRANSAMEAVIDRLIKPYGALLLHPAYSKVDPYIGYITRYAPGLRENGGVYSHASTWAVIALAKLGRLTDAYDLYRAMLPCKSEDNAAGYSAEPYVMPGNVDGPDSPREGRAGWTWYTGSSAWMHRVALDWLCGIRATRQGLTLNDGVPDWERYVVRRRFRGKTCEIEYLGRGSVRQIQVNGDETCGPIDPTRWPETTLQIQVSRG